MRLLLFPRQNGYEELGITFVLLNASGDIATTEIDRQSRAHVVVLIAPSSSLSRHIACAQSLGNYPVCGTALQGKVAVTG